MSQNDRSSEEDRKRRLSNKSVIKMNGDNTATISQPGAGAGAGAASSLEEANNELLARNLELDKLRREMRVKNDSEEQMR